MSINQNSLLIKYLPAEIHTGKEIYLDYYVIKPGTNSLVRKKIKLTRIKNKCSASEFRRYCLNLKREINEKLAANWNPFTEQEAPKGFTSLFEALDLYMRIKSKEMTENSIRSFKSYISMLKEYLTENIPCGDGIFTINFTQVMAKDYLNWAYLAKEISGKTYNNYVGGYHTIWSWLVENNYSKVNVFAEITRKKEKRKNRKEIPAEMLEKLRNYLKQEDDFTYSLMVELCFFGLIRPTEITKIKVSNINLKEQIIFFEGDETKNQDERVSSIPSFMIPLLKRQMKTGSGPLLFSDSENWGVGEKQLDSRKIAKKWANLRPRFNMKKDIQFYSLRDSGIIWMLDNGISPEFVRAQADHYSLEMTTKYSNHFRPTGIQTIKNIKIQ